MTAVDEHIDSYLARESTDVNDPQLWTDDAPKRHRLWQWFTRMRMHSLHAAQRHEHSEEFKHAHAVFMLHTRVLGL